MEINRGSTVCPRFIHGLSTVYPWFVHGSVGMWAYETAESMSVFWRGNQQGLKGKKQLFYKDGLFYSRGSPGVSFPFWDYLFLHNMFIFFGGATFTKRKPLVFALKKNFERRRRRPSLRFTCRVQRLQMLYISNWRRSVFHHPFQSPNVWQAGITTGVIILPTQTMHFKRLNHYKWPSIYMV